ncbi:MAG TPA: IS200/IS605 family transposase [Candidatus Angelobacter sp.]|nr:IS200/IS605 family transposase [Candidatus Angelobacter sp.]
MSHSYARNYIHLVFSTKERNQTIKKEIQPRLWAYMATTYRNHDILVKAVGGLDDHAHLLYQLPASLALSKSVYLVKTSSSQWMKRFVKGFDWQEGYAAFSVSASQLQSVIRYIENQGSYHKKVSFQQEYIALLKKHGVEYDPRYVFG